MIGSFKKLAVIGTLLLSVQGLAACGDDFLHEEGNISENRLQVEQGEFKEEISVKDFGDAQIAGLAQHYHRHGDGPLNLTVVYDPASRSSTAMVAANEASRILKALRKHGVRSVQPGILPVNGHGDEQVVMVSYTSYTAQAPKDCEVMPGINDTRIEAEKDYKLGCTIETLLARQIARPKDLKGESNSDVTSGRRGTNVLEGYLSGVPNQPLEGESSSGN